MPGRMIGHSVGWMVLALLLTANLMVGARLYKQDAYANAREQAYDKIALFTMVTQQVQQHYVDPTKTSYEDLIYGALHGMLECSRGTRSSRSKASPPRGFRCRKR